MNYFKSVNTTKYSTAVPAERGVLRRVLRRAYCGLRVLRTADLRHSTVPLQTMAPMRAPTQNGRARVEFAGSNNSVFTQNTVHCNERKATTHSERVLQLRFF